MMCRLDRFMISGEWVDLYPDSSQLALPKPMSDHCPIVTLGKILGPAFSVRAHVVRREWILKLYSHMLV